MSCSYTARLRKNITIALWAKQNQTLDFYKDLPASFKTRTHTKQTYTEPETPLLVQMLNDIHYLSLMSIFIYTLPLFYVPLPY